MKPANLLINSLKASTTFLCTIYVRTNLLTGEKRVIKVRKEVRVCVSVLCHKRRFTPAFYGRYHIKLLKALPIILIGAKRLVN
jgi:hypothetical protein